MKSTQALGQERFKSDKRQLGGLLMLIGVYTLLSPMAKLVILVGPNGTTASEGIPFSGLTGSILIIFMGLASIPTGYLQFVHDWGHKYLTGFLILFTQLAWMPFITDFIDVVKAARSGAAFIPPAYDPSEGDVKFVGAMGMMGILGYGTGFLGSLAFVQFSLYAFQAGKPDARRNGSYYKGHLTFYSFCFLVVGLSQLMLGSYVLKNFGSGPLESGPVAVAIYMVHFPEISIFVGVVQVLNALFGMARSFGMHNGADDHIFQVITYSQWLCTITFQIFVEVAHASSGDAVAAASMQIMLNNNLIVA
jgi:hypothetical protein